MTLHVLDAAPANMFPCDVIKAFGLSINDVDSKVKYAKFNYKSKKRECVHFLYNSRLFFMNNPFCCPKKQC